MAELSWDIIVPGNELKLRTRISSADRMWSGLDVKVLDASGGYFLRRPSATHHLAMCLAPTRSACRCEGPAQFLEQRVGDVDLVPAGAEALWEDEGPASFLSIDITPALIDSTAASLGVNPDRLELVPSLFLKDPQLTHIAWALKAELETGEPNDRLYAESLASALAARLVRRYSRVFDSIPARGLSKRQLRRVMEYIDGHLEGNLSLAALASVAGLGVSHFKAMFRLSLGMPVHQFVIHRRVQEAARLLVEGTKPISMIALQAGFSDQSHMARCMRRVMGTTPSALLRAARPEYLLARG